VVYYGALVSVVPGLLGAAVILYWQRLEEEALEAQHGEAYREYRKQTWF
jgi:protein-S-isoprenylcysteine O-methyltransferase Ste14